MTAAQVKMAMVGKKMLPDWKSWCVVFIFIPCKEIHRTMPVLAGGDRVLSKYQNKEKKNLIPLHSFGEDCSWASVLKSHSKCGDFWEVTSLHKSYCADEEWIWQLEHPSFHCITLKQLYCRFIVNEGDGQNRVAIETL
jgi:hypothetical protein